MRASVFILACLVLAIACEANPIPVPPPASMPLEDMHIQIQPVDGRLHATFTGEFTFTYIPSDVQSMLFPVPPDADNIGAWQDGVPLAWVWTGEQYPTILPEMPTIPMIGWPGPFPLEGVVFRVDYEHDLIKRPTEFIFFYASGTGKYFPTYDKTTTAYFDIELPAGYAVAGVWLDQTPHQYQIVAGHLMITVESQFGPIINDLIVSLVPATIYVATDGSDVTGDGSEQNPFRTIQKGIDTAVNGHTVLIADGTYTGTGNRDLDFKGRTITVRSENGPKNCIIDCGPPVHRGFYFHSGEDANSVVSGLTITNGFADAGGGIYCRDSSPTIENNIITGNHAFFDGVEIPGAGGGIYCRENSSPIITGNVITNNSVEGGGGGIFCGESSLILINNTITDNDAYSHAGMFSGPGYGGGIICNSSSLTIINNTISGNRAHGLLLPWTMPGEGGAIRCGYSSLTLVNTILWRNSPDEIEFYGGSTIEISYCDIQGGYAGTGNVNSDPCFADPCSGDYHLQSGAGRWDPNSESWVLDDVTSPCIDKGDPNSPVGAEPDPNGGRINMGAYGGTAQASKSPTCWDASACAGQPYGDANCDGNVNFADLFALKLYWAQIAPWVDPECCADFSHDGVVSLADIFALKAGFGTSGYSPSIGNQLCPP